MARRINKNRDASTRFQVHNGKIVALPFCPLFECIYLNIEDIAEHCAIYDLIELKLGTEEGTRDGAKAGIEQAQLQENKSPITFPLNDQSHYWQFKKIAWGEQSRFEYYLAYVNHYKYSFQKAYNQERERLIALRLRGHYV